MPGDFLYYCSLPAPGGAKALPATRYNAGFSYFCTDSPFQSQTLLIFLQRDEGLSAPKNKSLLIVNHFAEIKTTDVAQLLCPDCETNLYDTAAVSFLFCAVRCCFRL